MKSTEIISFDCNMWKPKNKLYPIICARLEVNGYLPDSVKKI